MNLRLAFLALMLISVRLSADAGCLDNSYHLAIRNDPHEYHLVETCICPCEKRYKQGALRGQCTQCGHYHVPKNFIITRTNDSQDSLDNRKTSTQMAPQPDPNEVLQNLINKYQKKALSQRTSN